MLGSLRYLHHPPVPLLGLSKLASANPGLHITVEYCLAGYIQMAGTLLGCSDCLVSIMFPP